MTTMMTTSGDESTVYIEKDYWLRHDDQPCLRCRGRILYRPYPLGIRIDTATGGIVTCGRFCSWPCVRGYCNQLIPSDEMERLTTKIMLDFKNTFSEGDDPDGHRYLQQFERFSQIPSGPSPHEFVPYGPLTHEKYRERWTSTFRPEMTFGSVIEENFRPIDDQSGITDTYRQQSEGTFRRSGFSTKIPRHVARMPSHANQRFLDTWMAPTTL